MFLYNVHFVAEMFIDKANLVQNIYASKYYIKYLRTTLATPLTFMAIIGNLVIVQIAYVTQQPPKTPQ